MLLDSVAPLQPGIAQASRLGLSNGTDVVQERTSTGGNACSNYTQPPNTAQKKKTRCPGKKFAPCPDDFACVCADQISNLLLPHDKQPCSETPGRVCIRCGIVGGNAQGCWARTAREDCFPEAAKRRCRTDHQEGQQTDATRPQAGGTVPARVLLSYGANDGGPTLRATSTASSASQP